MAKRTKKKKNLQDVNLDLIELIPELEYDDEKEQYKYASCIPEKRVIFVNLNELFDRDDLQEHSVFKIQDRKYYNPVIMNLMCIDMNEMLNNYDNDYPRMFTNIAMKIAVADSELQTNNGKITYPVEEFKTDIMNLVENVLEDIVDYTERVYNPVVKESKRKINTDLQVTEEMDKAFIVSSIAIRLIIPLVNNYCTYNINTNILIAQLFKNIILYTCNNDDGAFNKIIRIIDSRVSNTKYIHRVMWDKMFNILSMDPELKKLELFFKIIEGILPKLEPWNSSIQFLDSVIKNQLEFLFAANFGTEHKCNRGDLTNDSDDNNDDKMETLFIKNKSEDKYCLEVITVQQVISEIINNLEISEEDFKEFDKEYFGDRNVNKIQEFFIKNYYGSMFDSRVTTSKDKKYLLYNMIIEMQELGFEEIPNILLATISKEAPSKSNKKKIRIGYKNSNKYTRLMQSFQDVAEFIQNDNFVYKILDMIFSVNFIDNETGEIIDCNNEKIQIEIINFFNILKKR